MKALAWMSGSALGFSIMAIFVKRLGSVVPDFELVFFRSILNLLFVLAVMLWRRERLLPDSLNPLKSGRAQSLRLHLLLFFRGVVGFGGVSCLFYSIHHLPLPIAMMLGWCSPLFVMLFSRFFLGERLAQMALVAVSLAFVGLFLLLNPQLFESVSSVRQIPLAAVVIGISGAAMSGAAYVAVRAATVRVGANLIVVYFMVVSTLISAPLAAVHFKPLTGSEVRAVLVIGLAAAFGQVTMTHGYRHAPASQVSTMSLLNAAFSAFFGWWLFDERLSSIQWLGMAFLGVGIASITWSDIARKKPEQGASRVKLGYE